MRESAPGRPSLALLLWLGGPLQLGVIGPGDRRGQGPDGLGDEDGEPDGRRKMSAALDARIGGRRVRLIGGVARADLVVFLGRVVIRIAVVLGDQEAGEVPAGGSDG